MRGEGRNVGQRRPHYVDHALKAGVEERAVRKAAMMRIRHSSKDIVSRVHPSLQ
jgi:hypothetical protein